MDLAEISVSFTSPRVAGQCLIAGAKDLLQQSPQQSTSHPHLQGQQQPQPPSARHGFTKHSPRDPAEEYEFKARRAG